MKVITVECVVHKSSTNLYKHKHSPNKCKIFCLLRKIFIHATKSVKIPLLSGFVQTFIYHQDLPCAPYCYKKLSDQNKLQKKFNTGIWRESCLLLVIVDQRKILSVLSIIFVLSNVYTTIKALQIVIHQVDIMDACFLNFFLRMLQQNGSSKMLVLSGLILKGTKRAQIPLKNDIRDFLNNPPFKISEFFYVTINRDFERFHCFNFETSFLENENFF